MDAFGFLLPLLRGGLRRGVLIFSHKFFSGINYFLKTNFLTISFAMMYIPIIPRSKDICISESGYRLNNSPNFVNGNTIATREQIIREYPRILDK